MKKYKNGRFWSVCESMAFVSEAVGAKTNGNWRIEATVALLDKWKCFIEENFLEL
jgi:hypothetical protein